MIKSILAIGLFSGSLFAVTVSSATAGTGEWFATDGAKLRLVSLRDVQGGHIKAALQIQLEPGWKTYWRSPGASGLPPQVDFSTSTNIRSAEIQYPLPVIFSDGTAGYQGNTVFPIDIVAGDPGADVTINARGLIGICEEVCVPVQFHISLLDSALGTTSLEAARTINTGLSQLPDKASANFKITRVTLDSKLTKLRISARIPTDVKSAQLFLEGPVEWYLEPVTSSSIEDGIARFEVSLPADAELSDLPEAGLSATLVADGEGVEQNNIPIR